MAEILLRQVSLRGLYHKIHVFEFNTADSNCFVYLAYGRVLWVDYYKASDPFKTKVRAVFRSLALSSAHFQGMFSLSVICKV